MARSRHSRRFPRRKLKLPRLLLVIALFLLLAGSAYGIHQTQVRRQSTHLLDAARAAAAEKKWDAAAEYYRQYVNYKKRDTEGLSELAKVLDEIFQQRPTSKTYFAAERAYREALTVDPDLRECRWNATAFYLGDGEYSIAREHLQYLLKNDSSYRSNPEAYLRLAQCNTAEGKNDSALANLRLAIGTGKASPAVYLELAYALRREAARPEAQAEADQLMNDLVTSRPNDIDPRLARARYRLSIEARNGAVEDYRTAYELPGGHENTELILEYGDLLSSTDPKTAKIVLAKGLQTHPESVDLNLGLAEVLRRNGELKEAAKLLREAAARLPDSDRRILLLADRLVDIRENESVRVIAQRIAADPDRKSSADYLLGRLALSDGDWIDGIRLLQSAIPNLPYRWNLPRKAQLALAEGYKDSNRPELQVEALKAALQFEPGNVATQLELAEAYTAANRVAEAQEIYSSLSKKTPKARARLALLKFEEVLKQTDHDPKWSEFEALVELEKETLDPELEVAFARMLAMTKRGNEAVDLLKKSLARDPNRPQSWVLLAALLSSSDRAIGLRTLDEAKEKIGDRVELRLANAEWLLGGSPVDIPALLRLADGNTDFTTAERLKLRLALGEMLVRLGQLESAIDLFQKAAAENRFDLNLKLALFDLLVIANRTAEADRALEDIRKLDGDKGTVTTVAELTREIARTGSLPQDRILYWKTRLAEAITQRGTWGRLQTLAGNLAILDRQLDSAIDYYRKAIDLGESSELLVRRAVELLWDRQRYGDIVSVLARFEQKFALPPEYQRQLQLVRAVRNSDREAALKVARDPLFAESRNYREHLARVEIFIRQGEAKEAKEALKWAKSLNDVAPTVRIAIIRWLATNGEMPAAIAQWKETERRWSDPKLVWEGDEAKPLASAICKEAVGDLEGAEKDFVAAANSIRAGTSVLQQLADFYLRRGKIMEVEAFYERSLKSSSPEIAEWARQQRSKEKP